MSTSVRKLNKYIVCAMLLMLNAQINAQHNQAKQSNSIHEADQEDLKVLAHIADLQREIYAQINVARSKARSQLLQQLCDELEAIADNYTQLAPGTAFLGPFSSVSLVLKQRELQKRIALIEKQIYQR